MTCDLCFVPADDVAKIFVEKLEKVTNKIYNDFYRRPIPLRLTRAEQKSFDEAETCHICKKELLDDKVRDHCHFTGQYRGAAHNSCNLQCRKPMILPVIFHNLQGYDAHLFIIVGRICAWIVRLLVKSMKLSKRV